MWKCEVCESENADDAAKHCVVCSEPKITRPKITSVPPSSPPPPPTFKSKPERKKNTAVITVLAFLTGICILFFGCNALFSGLFQNTSTPNGGGVPVRVTKTVRIIPTSTKKSTRPTSTPRPTSTKKVPEYSCPDISKVKLDVGQRAKVAWGSVNLRSYAKVPNDWDANVVTIVKEGTRLTIIGGPECSHDGTWWKVKTDSGYTGWIRELLPDKRLLEPIN